MNVYGHKTEDKEPLNFFFFSVSRNPYNSNSLLVFEIFYLKEVKVLVFFQWIHGLIVQVRTYHPNGRKF